MDTEQLKLEKSNITNQQEKFKITTWEVVCKVNLSDFHDNQISFQTDELNDYTKKLQTEVVIFVLLSMLHCFLD